MPSTLDRPTTMETTQTRSFVRAALPWIVAAAMLLVYLVTLNKVVTTHSVWHLARVSGDEWRPIYVAPLTWLMTLPVKWLPSAMQLLGLNFISALCAAFTLAFLSRSVSILPQDRTQLQRNQAIDENGFLHIRLAWVPVAIAVLICGLQRSFWEHAIVGTGEMIDLLLFAYCVRGLLEYRIEEANSWLYKVAVVYGIGIANNFAMIAFFPAFIAALIWIKGLRFFRFDFLARMFLLGLAGMSFYLLLPLVHLQSDVVPTGFWQSLKLNLVSQQHLLFDYRKVALLPAIYAFVPLLLLGFRWQRGFGDQSAMGSLVANAAAVILHAGLLAFCLYVAFDPPISPRVIGAPQRQLGLNYIFLPCYFLGALAIGYYSGFLLLVFSGTHIKGRQRIVMPPMLNYAVTVVVSAGALIAAGALLAKNYPRIQRYNSRALHDYANAMAQSFSDKPAVVLSDDPTRLYAVSASLGKAADKHIFLDTRTLSEPAYHRFLRKRYGDRFPQLQLPSNFTGFPSPQLIQMLVELGEKNDLIYLHPSFGYYFEKFYPEPAKLVYRLKPYPPNSVEVPVPSPALIAEQKAQWDSLAVGPIKELKAELAKLPVEREQRYEFTAPYVGDFYARALDQWGVELQRAGRFAEAFPIFEEALALSPDNASALINRDANALWRDGQKRLPKLGKQHEEKLALYRGVDMLLMSCGPVDEPSFVTEFAGIFIQGGLYRQAEQMFLRGLSYSPTDTSLQLALANIHVLAQQPDRALDLVAKIPATNSTMQLELARITAFAHYAKDDFAKAKAILEKAERDFPNMDASYNALAQLYLNYAEKLRSTGNGAAADEQMTNAMKVIDRQIARDPKNPTAYFARGHIAMVANDYTGAVAFLDKVLQSQRDNGAALLNRAISNLQIGRLKEAKADYEEFRKRYVPNYQVYYGLAEIAHQQKDWRGVRDACKEYFRYSHGAPQSEVQFMRRRLEEAKKNS